MSTVANNTANAAARPLHRRLLRWTAWSLATLVLLVLLLLTGLTLALSTDRSSQWLLDTASSLLESDSLQLNYDWYEGTFARGLTLYELDIRLGDNRIHMERLHSRWNPFTLLSGQFNLDSLQVQGLTVNWHSSEEETEADASAPFDLSSTLDALLPLPIAIRLADVALERATIHFDDQRYDVKAMRIAAALDQRQLQIDNLHADAMEARADASLTIQLEGNYPLELALDWAYADLAAGELSIAGDLNDISLQHQLHTPAELHSAGTLSLSVADLLNNRLPSGSGLPLTMDLQHELLAATIELEALDGLALPGARLHTRGSLEQLEITGSSGIALTDPMPAPAVQAEAQWSLLLDELTQLTIRDLALRTTSGEVLASGLVDWQQDPVITLSLSLSEADPTAYLEGFPEALTLRDVAAQLQAELQLGADGPAGLVALESLTLQLNETALAADANVQLAGSLLAIEQLSVRAGDNQLQFSGELIDNNAISGQLSIAANALAQLYPDLSGRINGELQLAGELPLPALDIDLSANDLQFDTLRLEQLRINGSASGERNSFALQADGLWLAEQFIEAIRADLEGTPEQHQLQLQASSDIADLALALSGGLDANNHWSGTLSDSWFSTDLGRWQQSAGSALQLAPDNVTLETLCWMQNGSRLCLSGSLDGTRQLQASLSLDDYPLAVLNSSRANSVLRGFHNGELPDFIPAPAGLQLPFTLPEETALIGTVSLQAEASGPLTDLDALRVNANLAARDTALYLQIDLLPDEDDDFVDDTMVEQFSWPELWLTARLEDGSWRLQSQMELLQQDRDDSGESLRGLLDADLAMDAAQQLDGSINLDFDGLAWLAALSPQIQDPRGRIRGAVQLSGNLQEPGLELDLNVEEAGVNVAALGLAIEDVSMRLRGSHTDSLSLQAAARSGTGSLSVDAMIERPLEDNRRLQLRLQGEDFRVANLPELSAAISPDLRVTASTSGINAVGTLRIPLLDATVTALPETAVDVSSDAIIVRQREDREPARNAAQGDLGPLAEIPISANVRVILGDRVRFAAFGLNARLAGQLDINQRPGSAPLAYGELQVAEGSFETYGRLLSIEQGQLLFFGPLDNPGLDIRAVRQVDAMRVGVQMNGTLRNIRSSLFSTPSLPDADILSVMITGRPLAELGQQQDDSNALIGAITNLGISQGQGLTDQVRGQLGLDTLALESSGDLQDSSLTLGKYITPRIFIRYAVGLFETESVLGIDYSITDNIRLEAKSGQYQSVDLTYTLER